MKQARTVDVMKKFGGSEFGARQSLKEEEGLEYISPRHGHVPLVGCKETNLRANYVFVTQHYYLTYV